MTLEEVKLYMRVDDDTDDALITSLLAAAQQYVERKTGKIYKPEDELWNLCIKQLVIHWYENREVQATSTRNNLVTIDHTAEAIISHISLCGDYA
ncbi:head-tail connector protein [Anaeromusa sp.]|uniref:head-tail connector protein n=1 Tax=Anaeromusa sp. TaxID=1872520 RepID=UPI00262D8471|nr:head-tail connector protein [Anaeromusa sp.]MDD3157303.1 head-tail connector protein [Anaeromusa sp.]